MTPDDPRHGTTRGFHAGCRDTCCRTAIGRYEKETKYRRRHGIKWAIPALGCQRRIQALMALGWTGQDIADELGWGSRNGVRRILAGQKGKPCTWVERKTYRAISEAYERLSMTLPEDAPHRARCRTMARRKGWPPPLAWDDIDDPDEQPKGHLPERREYDVDPEVVERILSGHVTHANRAEREEVARRWAESERSLAELAHLTGWKVERYFKRKDVA